MSFFELPTKTAIGSAEVKHTRRGRFLYAFVTLQIAFIDEPTNHIEYKLSIPEELDEYHLQAVRTTEISEVKSALEQGIALGLERGNIKDFPMTNYRVTILQVIRSVGESSTVALTAAAAKAVWNALETCSLRSPTPSAYGAYQAPDEVKDFQRSKFEPLWIDFDEEANRWDLHFADYIFR
jgi:translation elongation factor EF-G